MSSAMIPDPDLPWPFGVPDGELRFLIPNLGWTGYRRLLDLFVKGRPRMAYLDGAVEMMSPLPLHETFRAMICRMVQNPAVELNIPMQSLGATTFFSERLDRGIDPDEGFYLTHVGGLTNQPWGDREVVPDPDLVVSIEVTPSMIDKLAILAGLEIPEIWRHDGKRLGVLCLRPDGRYEESSASRAFPFLPMDAVARQLEGYRFDQETSRARAYSRWVRETVAPLHQAATDGLTPDPLGASPRS